MSERKTGRRGARQHPTQAEIDMWHSVLQDVKPLPGRKRVSRPTPPPPRAEPAKGMQPSDSLARSLRPLPLPDLIPGQPVGLDRNSGRRLKQGRYPVEARLDLHGMTQEQAYYALNSFLARSAAMDRRCVLVITGKGFRRVGEADGVREPGILRSSLPRWLNEPPNRERVLAVTEAQAKDGGGGAFYVLLRRRRPT